MRTTFISMLLILSTSGCSAMLDFKDYTNPNCGNGVLDSGEGEECDNGENNSDELADACRTDCHEAYCGDGVTDTGEMCDSGPDNGQPLRCNNSCDGYVPSETCGDGTVDDGEECDEGEELNGVYGGTCATDCSRPSRHCGDGIRDEEFEQCDGADVGEMACLDIGPYTGGDLLCDPQCMFNASDCTTDAVCAPLMDSLECGSVVVGSTTMPGSTNTMDEHCMNGLPYTGREVVYRFLTSQRETVTLNLVGMTGDLDVFVMQDSGEGCQPDNCIAAGAQVNAESEMVTFVAEANVEYLILIDGWQGDVSG